MTHQPHRRFEPLSQAARAHRLSIRNLRRGIGAGDLTAYCSGPRVIRLDPDDVDHLMVRIPTAS